MENVAEGTMADAATPVATGDPLTAKVREIIDEIRPYLQDDGGDCELLKVEDGVVYVRLVGACVGCPSSLATLKGGVENRIREAIPEITSVEMV